MSETSQEHPIEWLVRKFHTTYERLAPDYGYQTREDTKTIDLQSQNGKLMIAVMGEVFGFVTHRIANLERTNAALEKEVARLKGELAWIEEVRNKQPAHPDDERMWIPEMLRAKHEVERLQGLVERAVVAVESILKLQCPMPTSMFEAGRESWQKWLKDAGRACTGCNGNPCVCDRLVKSTIGDYPRPDEDGAL